ncbi:MAG: PIN domain nuclease [Nitrospinae bacterium]|nr:PIN domain nuclease [Nitrospinota bacterium]
MIAFRLIFVAACVVIGGIIGHLGASGVYPTLRVDSILEGALYGLILSGVAVLAEINLRRLSLKSLAGAALGMFFTLVLANMTTFSLIFLALTPSTGNRMLLLFINIVAAFIGASIGVRAIQEVDLTVISRILKGKSDYGTLPKVLDTSVIIDGRIADICETGFFEGTLIIPNFVLRELHHIADSPDEVKRVRGRRGLDVVQRLQNTGGIELRIIDEDFPRVQEVDLKLLELCKKTGARVMTNDFNLTKMAELHNVGVININQLATSTKPAILPGEELASMMVVKEGKEPNQGLAYLDDGTMVIIDNARKKIGQKVNLQVTSVLQTPTGRMIFGKLSPETAGHAAHS